MRTLEANGKKIQFPDTMSPDEIRAVLKVMESPGKYAKLKSESDRIQECMDQIAGAAKAMESSSTKTIEQVVKSMEEGQKKLADCMEMIWKHQAELVKALGPTQVTLNAPDQKSEAYTFTVKRDKEGQMISVEATPNG